MENADDRKQYQGWANHETWTVSLWLDNEESTYRYWRQEAKRHRQTAKSLPQVRSGTWTAQEAARFYLADQLKKEVTDAAPLHEPSLYTDLLLASLSGVDWLEIVDSWMSE